MNCVVTSLSTEFSTVARWRTKEHNGGKSNRGVARGVVLARLLYNLTASN